MEVKTVGLASDHAGFPMKQFVLQYLEKKGYPVKDYGTYSDESVDYPDFAHAVAEDRYFYIPLMMTDSGLNITRHALAEHHKMDELLEQLTETEFSNPGWLAIAKKLSETVHHHLQEEEHGFFQQAGKILLDAQKTALAKQYQQEYKKYKKIEKDSLV